MGLEYHNVPEEFGKSAPSEFRKIAVRNVAKVGPALFFYMASHV